MISLLHDEFHKMLYLWLQDDVYYYSEYVPSVQIFHHKS